MIKLKLKLSNEQLILGDLYPQPYLLNDEIRGFFNDGYFICNNDKPIPQKGVIRKIMFNLDLNKRLVKCFDINGNEYYVKMCVIDCFYEIDLSK